MRCFFILLISMLCGYSSSAQASHFIAKKIDERIYDKVEIEADYKGGQGAWLRFLQKNLQYPTSSITQESTGSITTRFIVYTSGKIGNLTVVRGGSDTALANEVMRVIKLSNGKWEPAMAKGKPVNSYKELPLTICLREN